MENRQFRKNTETFHQDSPLSQGFFIWGLWNEEFFSRLFLAGGFKYVLSSPRTLGKMNPFSWAYFSHGLVFQNRQPDCRRINFFNDKQKLKRSLPKSWGNPIGELSSPRLRILRCVKTYGLMKIHGPTLKSERFLQRIDVVCLSGRVKHGTQKIEFVGISMALHIWASRCFKASLKKCATKYSKHLKTFDRKVCFHFQMNGLDFGSFDRFRCFQ